MKIESQLLIVCCAIAGMSCSRPYTAERMEKTSRDIVHIIKTGEAGDFRDKIGVPVKDKDDRFQRKFNSMQAIFQKHVDESDLKVIVTDSIDSFSGRRLVMVPIVDSSDAVTDYKSVQLHLYFGPPSMISWKVISGYELKVEPRFP